MTPATILTGATGFLGMELLARLVERDQGPILCLIRAGDQAEAELRLDGVRLAVFGDADAHRDRITAVRADLEQPGLGLDPGMLAALAEQAGEIIHSAAAVAFNQSLQDARRINVGGTRSMLDLAMAADRAGVLTRMVQVSTAYVAGDRVGLCHAHELDVEAPHRNTYERTKAEAEVLVREAAAAGLPVEVVRPSIIVGHSETGWTSSFNVVYGPLRAYSVGMLRMVPGRSDAPVDVVPVDHVAASIVALLDTPVEPGRTTHLTAGDLSPQLHEFRDLGAEYFDQKPGYILPPFAYTRFVHPVLVRTGPQKRREIIRRSEALMAYFQVRAHYDASPTRALMTPLGVAPPPLFRDYFPKLMGFAVRAQWGKNTITRAEAMQTQVPVRA